MAYLALYRKWRPLTFTDVVRQEHVVNTLRNSVINNKIAHAYLFCGTRGTGKTTIAKVFSRAVNCLNPQDGNPCNECEICKGILDESIHDVYEIDAASNTGVDNIREIKDDVTYMPSRATYKVYIIDEVHMLSASAFNALLKTLEEPPSHVIFILATTEPNKLPPTVLSRCQRYDFKRIDVDGIIERLSEIIKDCGIEADPDALGLIARLSEGALRDAISILDRCISTGSVHLTYDDVISSVGIVQDSFMLDFTDALVENNIPALLEFIRDLFMSGKDLSLFLSELIVHFRNLMICKVSKAPEKVLDFAPKAIQLIKEQSDRMQLDYIFCVIKELSSLHQKMNRSANTRTLLETAVIRISCGWFSNDNDDIISRLSRLEQAQTVQSHTTNDQVPVRGKGVTVPEVPKPQVHSIQRDEVDANKQENPAVNDTQSDQQFESKNFEQNEDYPEWNAIMADLGNFGKKILETVLSSAKAVRLSSNQIGLIFPAAKTFERSYMSKSDSIKALQDTIKRVTGNEMNIKIIEDNEVRYAKTPATLQNTPGPGASGTSAASAQPAEIEQDELTIFFEEKDIPFDIIDE